MATQAPPMTAAEQSESIAYLRERGVEVDLPEERAAGKRPQATIPGAPPFSFVHIPADSNAPVVSLETVPAEGDVLKSLLAPCFASNEVMDPEVVMRETSARVKNMVMSGGLGDIRAPSASSIAKEAEGGSCEAYQLAPASESNGWRAVRLYIDEVGALRSRPRNRRAEDLAAASGLAGLSIHGDAYVGRCERAAEGGERNASFKVAELAHSSEWVLDALKAHQRQACATHAGCWLPRVRLRAWPSPPPSPYS